jgi:hypothetical protein
MNKETEPAATDPPAPSAAGQPRRRCATALLNTTALLATTALVAAFETKLPPFRGD